MEILRLNQESFREVLKRAVVVVKNGKVLVCPTDTVYGLICDAASRKAVKELFKIKKRPKGKPIPIFVKDLKMAKELADINRDQEKFLKKAWLAHPNFSKDAQKKMVKIGPKIWAGKGKVTVVLKKKDKLPKILFGKNKTIGLRIPNYKFINRLLSSVDKPLTGTSANISGRPPSTKIKEVLNQFKNKKYQPDLVIDAGNLKQSRPSAVIDMTVLPPKILRN